MSQWVSNKQTKPPEHFFHSMGNWLTSAWQGAAPLVTEASVDLTIYAGSNTNSSDFDRALGGRTWYEIAHLPIIWQPARATNITAFLSWDVSTKRLYIRNSQWIDGRRSYVEGVGVRDPEADDNSNSKLLITFKPNMTQPIVGPGNQHYWILMVEPTQYRYAVVSGGDRNTLWIMSATPTMSDEDFEFIYNQLTTKFGYTKENLSKLIFPKHLAQPQQGM